MLNSKVTSEYVKSLIILGAVKFRTLKKPKNIILGGERLCDGECETCEYYLKDGPFNECSIRDAYYDSIGYHRKKML